MIDPLGASATMPIVIMTTMVKGAGSYVQYHYFQSICADPAAGQNSG